MNNSKSIWSAVVVVAIIAIIGLFVPHNVMKLGNASSVTTAISTAYNGSVGMKSAMIGDACGDSNTAAYCVGPNFYGALYSTSTVQTASTLAASELAGYSTISVTPTGGSLTLTLPASSTLTTWLPNIGDTTSFVMFNASTTAGVNVVIAGGTGTTLVTASSSVTNSTIGPASAGRFEVLRKPNTDLLFMMVPFK